MKPIFKYFINLLKAKKVLSHHATTKDFFNLSPSTQRELVLDAIDTNKTHPWVANIFAAGIGNEFFTISTQSKNPKNKYYANVLREICFETLESRIKKSILKFLVWDLERRNWHTASSEFKIQYLDKRIKEIDEDIQFGDQVLQKYFNLYVDYLLSLFDQSRDTFLDSIKSEEYNGSINEDQLFKTIDFFKQKKITFDAENIEPLKAQAKAKLDEIIEGHSNEQNRYGYLFGAFFGALQEYKSILIQLSSKTQLGLTSISIIASHFEDGKIEEVISFFRSVFASVPYLLSAKTNEADFHIYCHLVLFLAGCNPDSESFTNTGRVDCVVETSNIIYIIEFKVTSSAKAMEQIKRKEYYEKYMFKNKRIILVGISFDQINKTVNREFTSQELNH